METSINRDFFFQLMTTLERGSGRLCLGISMIHAGWSLWFFLMASTDWEVLLRTRPAQARRRYTFHWTLFLGKVVDSTDFFWIVLARSMSPGHPLLQRRLRKWVSFYYFHSETNKGDDLHVSTWLLFVCLACDTCSESCIWWSWVCLEVKSNSFNPYSPNSSGIVFVLQDVEAVTNLRVMWTTASHRKLWDSTGCCMPRNTAVLFSISLRH